MLYIWSFRILRGLKAELLQPFLWDHKITDNEWPTSSVFTGSNSHVWLKALLVDFKHLIRKTFYPAELLRKYMSGKMWSTLNHWQIKLLLSLRVLLLLNLKECRPSDIKACFTPWGQKSWQYRIKTVTAWAKMACQLHEYKINNISSLENS